MFVQRMRRRRGLAVMSASVAVGLMALTGCDQSPSVAARVGDTSISTHQVDLMTQVLCIDRAHAAQRQKVPVATVRAQALQTLVEATLDRKFAAQQHLPDVASLVNQQLAGFDKLFGAVPQEDRAATRQLVRGYFRGQIQLQQLGAFTLRKQNKKVDAQSAAKAGLALRKKFDATQEVTVNPRYGAAAGSTGTPAMSVPVSDFAKSASASSPDATWSAGLPANQVCG